MPKVVVIGSGAAGLAAARKLSNRPGFEVLVLEALDRVGGRVLSQTISGQTVDLGASWMHDTRANPLFEKALKHGWPMKYTDITNCVYTKDEGELPPTIEPIVSDLQSQISEHCMLNELRADSISMKSFVESKINEMPLISAKEKSLAKYSCRSIEHYIGMPWDQIPLGDGLFDTPQGRDAFMLGEGYSQVIEWLQNESKATVRLNEEVTGVDGHNVTTSKGVYHADYIICTIPLGALKCSYSMFTSLPIEIVKSIKQTNMAALGKVIVEFPHIFWGEKDISFVTKGNEFVSIVNPYRSPILMVLTGPPLTEQVESDPHKAYELIKWAFEVIANGPVPKPKKVIVSNWTQSKYFRGSYSARSIGQSYDDLVMPFIEGAGHLRFAGEHTILDGNGCVHGAYNSGLREADVVLEMHKECVST